MPTIACNVNASQCLLPLRKGWNEWIVAFQARDRLLDVGHLELAQSDAGQRELVGQLLRIATGGAEDVVGEDARGIWDHIELGPTASVAPLELVRSNVLAIAGRDCPIPEVPSDDWTWRRVEWVYRGNRQRALAWPGFRFGVGPAARVLSNDCPDPGNNPQAWLFAAVEPQKDKPVPSAPGLLSALGGMLPGSEGDLSDLKTLGWLGLGLGALYLYAGRK